MTETDDLKSQIKELERRRDDAAVSRDMLRLRIMELESVGNRLYTRLNIWYNVAGACGKVDAKDAEALVDWEILTNKNND